VKRLRKDALSQEQLWTLRDAAADRIEQLEAALREICDGPRDVDKSYPELLAEVRCEARAALEGK